MGGDQVRSGGGSGALRTGCLGLLYMVGWTMLELLSP